MAITKENKVILVSGASPAGASTKLAPGRTGTAVDCSSYYGGQLMYKIINGSSAPSTACVITFQVSPDNVNWFDYYTVGGDTVASSNNSGSRDLDRGIVWVRAVSYGNQTNPVTVEVTATVITGI